MKRIVLLAIVISLSGWHIEPSSSYALDRIPQQVYRLVNEAEALLAGKQIKCEQLPSVIRGVLIEKNVLECQHLKYYPDPMRQFIQKARHIYTKTRHRITSFLRNKQKL